MAVDLNFEGLLAPVVRQASDKRLRAIARDIADLANRARTKALGPDDLVGGTFTLSNSGSFGTLFVAPIINQPQVAILSTDGITRRPVAITDERGHESIAIHSVGIHVVGSSGLRRCLRRRLPRPHEGDPPDPRLDGRAVSASR